MADPPFDKYKPGYEHRQSNYNGVWNYVKKEKKYLKFHSWPKPFNAIERIDVLNCNEVLLLRVQFIAEIAGEFWWDSKVPSPNELFRNWIFGALRCGSKMGVKTHLPGPGSLFLDKKGKVMLAGLGGLLGAPLLYWSMAQTGFKALDTWSTLLNVQAMCEDPEAHGIMRGGHARIQFEGEGGIPFYTTVYDPHNWANALTGFYTFPEGMVHAWATGTATNTHPSISAQFGYQMWTGDDGENIWHDIVIAPGETASLSLGGFNSAGATCQVRVRLGNDLPGVLVGVDTLISTFVMSTNTEDPNNRFPLGPWEEDPSPYETCQRLYEPAS